MQHLIYLNRDESLTRRKITYVFRGRQPTPFPTVSCPKHRSTHRNYITRQLHHCVDCPHHEGLLTDPTTHIEYVECRTQRGWYDS